MKTETNIIKLPAQQSQADRREELFKLIAKIYVESIFKEFEK